MREVESLMSFINGCEMRERKKDSEESSKSLTYGEKMPPSSLSSSWPRRQAAVSRFLLCVVLFGVSTSTQQHFIALGFAPVLVQKLRQQQQQQQQQHAHKLPSRHYSHASGHRILLDPTRPFHYSLSSSSSSFVLLMSKKDDDSEKGDTDKEEQTASQQQQQKEDEIQKASISKSNLPNKSKDNKDNNNDPYAGLKLVLRNTFDAINTVWSIIILFLGVSISCGLVLNLLGYGYQVNPTAITLLLKQQQSHDGSPSSPPPLLRIDTIERFRQEAQFQREINNSMKEKRQRDDASAASAATAATVVSTITATVAE